MEKQLEFAEFGEERAEAVVELARQAEELETSSEEQMVKNRYADSLIALDSFRLARNVASDALLRNKWEHECARARSGLQDDRLWAEKRLGAETAERLLRKAFDELAERKPDTLVTKRDIKFALSDRLW